MLNFLQEACRTHPEDYLSTLKPTTSVQLKHKTIINNGGKKRFIISNPLVYKKNADTQKLYLQGCTARQQQFVFLFSIKIDFTFATIKCRPHCLKTKIFIRYNIGSYVHWSGEEDWQQMFGCSCLKVGGSHLSSANFDSFEEFQI